MRKIILGTDFLGDCDDAVAIRILCRAHKAGKIRLLGIGINACDRDSVTALYGLLESEGVSVPVGIDRKGTDFDANGCKYHKNLVKIAKERVENTDVPDAAELYRKLIAEEDGKVEIAEIGFLQVLSDAIQSTPDEISSMNGVELFKEKVERVWSMAGKWDVDGGREYNFCCNGRSVDGGRRLLKNCPVPITFLGFEIGVDVISGSKLDENDLLRQVLADYGTPNGRSSWDPMLVQLAITGDPEEAGYSVVQGTAALDENGNNHFTPSPSGSHSYVVRNYPPSHYADVIDDLIK
jgi:hypothetical protein